MTEPNTEVVLTVNAADGQYHLESSPDRVDFWPSPTDGVTTGEDNWIAVLTGTEWGPVTVHIHIRRQPPGAVAPGWDMAVERDITIDEDNTLIVTDPYRHQIPVTIIDEPGTYRARIHVRDRDNAKNVGDTTEPIETHLIELWPATHRETPRILFGQDNLAQHFR